ncbi:hypothetical protein RKE29_20330 [Streptomyces sp. B1866]|uniref:5'-methylthioadenosine/S-adenosylhomocysteine nucleosidase family protein n=1 Tax=Streptomyces sp. B1866 TaxID=3075431 RepID=UPI00288E1518|nr:hypothetical protein [Streptomyces sp. B1866]MDT3398962.1 hypothetical protein [Streptomyces sp. B1866]
MSKAQHGRVALLTARQRGKTGLVRLRGPLSVMLYVAAYDGRLVWRDLGCFALLEPPPRVRHRSRGGGLRMRALRGVDRYWDWLWYLGPPLLELAAAVCMVPFRFAVAGLLLALLAVVHVAVWMLLSGAVSTAWIVRAFSLKGHGDEAASEELPGRHWAVRLLHQDRPDRDRTQELLRRTRDRLAAIVSVRADAAAGWHGYAVRQGRLAETLVILQQGVTTDEARRAVEAWSTAVGGHGRGAAVMVVPPEAKGPDPAERRLIDSGAFGLWYLLALVALVVLMAPSVADWERSACPRTGCSGRPATYLDAVHWLSQRLLLSDPPGLAPATDRVWIIGWLVSAAGLMAVPVSWLAVRQNRRYARLREEPYERMRRQVENRTSLLVLVTNTTERTAVFQAVRAVNGREPEPRFLKDHTVFALGPVSGVDVLVAQTEQSAHGPGGATVVAASLLDQLTPDYLIMVGICWGLRPGDGQRLGDILVAGQLRVMDHRKVTETPDGGQAVILRGDKVTASSLLLDRLRAAEVAWRGESAVHFGLMLSAGTLSNARSVRDRFAELEPDAIGGEMEGSGVYAAAARGRTHWILVKAISDWGHGKTDDAREPAARNAAEYVVAMLRMGALDPRP